MDTGRKPFSPDMTFCNSPNNHPRDSARAVDYDHFCPCPPQLPVGNPSSCVIYLSHILRRPLSPPGSRAATATAATSVFFMPSSPNPHPAPHRDGAGGESLWVQCSTNSRHFTWSQASSYSDGGMSRLSLSLSRPSPNMHGHPHKQHGEPHLQLPPHIHPSRRRLGGVFFSFLASWEFLM